MSAETIPMFENLPVDNPGGKQKRQNKEERTANSLQKMMGVLMKRRKVELVDIHEATEIPWSTLMTWYRGIAKGQVADERLLKMAQYFGVSLEYLCFEIGKDPHFKGNENE